MAIQFDDYEVMCSEEPIARAERRARIEAALASAAQGNVLEMYNQFFHDNYADDWEIIRLDDGRYCHPPTETVGTIEEAMHGYDWWVIQLVDDGCDMVEETAEDGSRRFTLIMGE